MSFFECIFLLILGLVIFELLNGKRKKKIKMVSFDFKDKEEVLNSESLSDNNKIVVLNKQTSDDIGKVLSIVKLNDKKTTHRDDSMVSGKTNELCDIDIDIDIEKKDEICRFVILSEIFNKKLI